jgi:hypothetical protein
LVVMPAPGAGRHLSKGSCEGSHHWSDHSALLPVLAEFFLGTGPCRLVLCPVPGRVPLPSCGTFRCLPAAAW